MSDKKEYVKLWLSYGTYFQSYSPEEIGHLVLAMLAYKDTGEEPDFQGPERFIWPAIRRDINEAREAQEAAAAQARENGKKGGRPRTRTEEPENPVGFFQTPDNPRTKDIDNDKGHLQGQGQVREGTALLPAGSAGGRRGAAGRRKKDFVSRGSPEELREDIQRMQRYYEKLALAPTDAPEETSTSPPGPDRPPGDQTRRPPGI